MKKRTLISIVITIVCIVLTNRLWFNIKPLQISFNAAGHGNTKFEFFLNKKDNNELKKVKYGIVEANLDNNDSVEFFINRVHSAKKVKITVSASIAPPPERLETLVLSEIQLRYGKYKLDDLHAFSAENAKLKIDGDKLIIYPESDSFSLIYNKPVNIKGSTNFDIKILLIIAVLSFLLSYKLTSYLADFKTLNNASRIDIIFLLLFFVILFIPMSNMDTETKYSEKENRELAEFKPFIQNNEINYNFGNDFNDWFSDRFFLRYNIVRRYMDTKFNISFNYYETSKGFINKRNNFMSERLYPSKDNLSEQELKEYAYSLNELNKFCKENKIKLYILTSPAKENIYAEELYPFIGKTNEVTKIKQMNSYVLKQDGINIIYTYDALKKLSKTDAVYFKTDHHLTDSANYLVYQLLMKEIVKDFPDLKIEEESKFDNFYTKEVRSEFGRYFFEGRTYHFLNLHNTKVLDKRYKYYKHKKHNLLSTQIINQRNKEDYTGKEYYYPPGKYKAIFMGDSYIDNLTEFVPYSFKETKRIYTNIPTDMPDEKRLDFKKYENDIKKYKPDILVIYYFHGGLHTLKHFFKEEKI